MQALGLAWGDPGSHASQSSYEEIHTVLPEPIHRGARLLFDSWRARVKEGRFVIGRDLPTRELARVLSGLALFEPVGRDDFRVRLAGLQLRRRFGQDVTGALLSELFDASACRDHNAQMRALMQTGHPLVVDVRTFAGDRMAAHFELVGLRVFAPDGATPWALSGVFYHDWRL